MSVLEIVQGNDEVLTILGRDAAGALQDLTGLTLHFMAKRSSLDPDSAAVLAKSSPGTITIDPDQTTNTGQATIAIAAADTRELDVWRPSLAWDLTAVDGAGKVTTLASGQLIITPSVRKG